MVLRHEAERPSFGFKDLEAKNSRNPSTLAALLSGSVGGACQVVVGQPLDLIRVRAQIASPGQYKNTLDIITQTYKKEGFFAFYKGMASPLLGIAAVNSLLFAAYGQAKKLVSPYPTLTLPQTAIAGGIGGAVNSLLASPVELFKIRLQGQYGAATDKKLRDVFREMYSQYGIRHGVMRGFWITVLRETPALAGFYTGYEFSKRQFHKRIYGDHAPKDKALPVWATLAAGSVGGIGYWTACYPFDVVKSRVQATTTPLRGMGYISDTFRTIYREEGIGAFFKGLTPTYLRTIPAAAATFMAFELTMEYLKKNTSIY